MVARRVPTRDAAPGMRSDVVSSLARSRVEGDCNILPGLDLKVNWVGNHLSPIGNDDRGLVAKFDRLQSPSLNRAGARWTVRESDSHSTDRQVCGAEYIRKPEPNGFSRN